VWLKVPNQINWVRINEDVYPHCSKCGGLLKIFVFGEPSTRTFYVLECYKCRRVYVRKTSIRNLKRKAMLRWMY